MYTSMAGEDGSLVMLEPLFTDGDAMLPPQQQEVFVLLDGIPQVTSHAHMCYMRKVALSIPLKSSEYSRCSSKWMGVAGSVWKSEAVQYNGGRPLHSSILGIPWQCHRKLRTRTVSHQGC